MLILYCNMTSLTMLKGNFIHCILHIDYIHYDFTVEWQLPRNASDLVLLGAFVHICTLTSEICIVGKRVGSTVPRLSR